MFIIIIIPLTLAKLKSIEIPEEHSVVSEWFVPIQSLMWFRLSHNTSIEGSRCSLGFVTKHSSFFLFPLSIFLFISAVAPTVKIIPPQGILREGDSLSLTCSVTGNPLWVYKIVYVFFFLNVSVSLCVGDFDGCESVCGVLFLHVL